MNIDINMPDIGMDEAEVTEIMVRVNDIIKLEQSIITVEGEKASMEVPAPFSGKIKEIKINVGDKVSKGSLIMVLELETNNDRIPTSSVNKKNTQEPYFMSNKNIFIENDVVHATPIIRRLAYKFGINLETVNGTGSKGRILKEDIQPHIEKVIKSNKTGTEISDNSVKSQIPTYQNIDFSKFGEIELVKLGRVQKISGTNLHRNWITIPHVTQFEDVDVTDLEVFRKQQNDEAIKKKLELKITPLVFVIKSVAKVIEEFPYFNSSLSSDGQTLILKKYINIGIAVNTSNGLVVPILRDVNKKGIIKLSSELLEISKKARSGKLNSSDMQGGSFSISNLGGIGGSVFTPIINAPEVAILGVSKSLIKPFWNGEKFIPRLMMPLSLSYDHRVINGVDGASFLCRINQLISDIRYLIM